jgi:hypothetical protein
MLSNLYVILNYLARDLHTRTRTWHTAICAASARTPATHAQKTLTYADACAAHSNMCQTHTHLHVEGLEQIHKFATRYEIFSLLPRELVQEELVVHLQSVVK